MNDPPPPYTPHLTSPNGRPATDERVTSSVLHSRTTVSEPCVSGPSSRSHAAHTDPGQPSDFDGHGERDAFERLHARPEIMLSASLGRLYFSSTPGGPTPSSDISPRRFMKLPERLNTGHSGARPTNPFHSVKTYLDPSSQQPFILPKWNVPGPSASRALSPSEVTEGHIGIETLQVEADEGEATRRLIMSMVNDETRAAEDAAYARRLQGGGEWDVPLGLSDLPGPVPGLSEATHLEQHPQSPPTGVATEGSPGWDSMLDLLAAVSLDGEIEQSRPPALVTCFICSQFTEIHDSDEAGSPQPPGLRLPCTLEHGFCRECLLHYIQGKLNAAQPGKKTFPIACPGCVLGIPYAITENEAIRILPPDLMDRWLGLRLKEENFAMLCPNLGCSAPIYLAPSSAMPSRVCAACSTSVCLDCKAPWHDGITCAQYQSSPKAQKSVAHRAAVELIDESKSSRCPRCSTMVELMTPRQHIACRCGAEFCSNCRAPWDQGCTRYPRCQTDEETLQISAGPSTPTHRQNDARSTLRRFFRV